MPLIQVRGLRKLYRMGDSVVRALDGVDLDIERGEFVAITGPSGSGKSTIMHLLGCLDRPTAGTYLLNGSNVGELSDRELAAIRNKQIGFVFQTFNLINRTTALENVGVPLFYARQSNTRAAALRALERVGLAPRAGHRPSELSGGERQRVAIARAIVNDPILLFADEPTGNLDTRTGRQIMEVVRKLSEQGVTIVLVTHEHDVAIQAHRIVQMLDGKIVSDRPVEEFERVDHSTRRPGAPLTTGMPSPVAIASPAVAATPMSSQEPVSEPISPPAATAKGVTGALLCGIAAPLLVVTATIFGSVARGYQPDPTSHELPPTDVIVAGMGLVLGLVGALALAIAAIAWGWAILKRIRGAPVELRGRMRARAAMVLGCLTLLSPVLVCLIGWALK